MILILLVLGLLFLSGCTSPQPPTNNTTLSCNEYCISQPHIQCVGEWKISGTYPNCVCNFECKTEPPQNNTPPPPPPPANNTTQPPPANNTTKLTCEEFCPTQPHIQCVGAWNISGTYPDCNCGFTCDIQEPQTIEITARQWEFDPGTITVKKGEKVKLMITSQDVTHGFSLPAFNIEETLKPGETVTLEFVPDKAGSFSFKCSVFCGTGHSGMKGTLIVED
jgi:heme/copper-type cytochrome/quinol oxidase subunit 2